MSRARFIALLLALVTLAVYLPVVRDGFILYDDGDYVTQNKMVQEGLTLASVKWAFTTFDSANWHPLTWLSHMMDCELFGVNAAGSHLVNALFHAVNTVLLFALWLQLTRRETQAGTGTSEMQPDTLWPAAFIAALFALHPLHVESVAWASERKDVLSGFFGLLALLCYARYVQARDAISDRMILPHPGPLPLGEGEFSTAALKRPTPFTSAALYYWLALLFFACGLMCKPMLVTLPFVMLLLDYWPLGRFGAQAIREGAVAQVSQPAVSPISKSAGDPNVDDLQAGKPATQQTWKSAVRVSFGRLLFEKIPFFALTIGSCIVTWFAQNTGAVRSLKQVPLVYRMENAPVAVATYLLKMVWPARLAVIYPMPQPIPAAALAVSLLVLILVTAAVWLARKKEPFLIVGWLWFLGTLVPVLGLVKVGDAAMADRYTYIPSIGIFMAVAFGTQRMGRRFSLPKFLLPAMAVIILVALTVVTERQLAFWRNDDSLFKHAVEVTTDNADAMINYGVALENEGKPVEALAQYQQAVKLASSSYLAHVDDGDLLLGMGDTNGALVEFQQAVQWAPNPATSSELHDRLGNVLAGMGRLAEATNEFYEAMSLAPASAWPHLHLGNAFAAQNDFTGATNEFSKAMERDPGNPAPLVEWGKALLEQGRNAEAMNKLQVAIQLEPDNYQTLTFVARVLASDENAKVRNGPAALALAQKADALTNGGQPLVKDVLGMAYANVGQFNEAQRAVQDALTLATAAGMKKETITAMQERLELYEKHQPWREAFSLRSMMK